MELIKIETLKPESLVSIEQRRKELKQLVKENSFIECTSETHEEAKRRRTALRKGRTTVQNEVKEICSKLASISRGVKDAGDQLILIVQKAEYRQQDSVTAFEEEKERIRQEKIRLEQERKDKLKEEILSWMEGMNDRISQAQNSKDLEKIKNEILLVAVSEEAQSEFANDITWSKTQLELTFNNRVANIELQEQRAEQEKLRKEKEALERKAEQEKKELEQKLRETEQAKQELEQKLNGPETEVQSETIEKQEHSPSMESIQENQDQEEVPNAELIKIWNISASPNGENCITESDLNEVMVHLEVMEKGSELYIKCDEITVAEYEMVI